MKRSKSLSRKPQSPLPTILLSKKFTLVTNLAVSFLPYTYLSASLGCFAETAAIKLCKMEVLFSISNAKYCGSNRCCRCCLSSPLEIVYPKKKLGENMGGFLGLTSKRLAFFIFFYFCLMNI